ncbi:MAG: alpha-galactosidase [Pseudomonadota bacterium]
MGNPVTNYETDLAPMPAEPQPDFYALRGGGSLLVIEATEGARPRILYAGPDLPGVEPVELAVLATRQHAPGGPEQPIELSMLNPIGTGHPSPPGLLVHREGRDWAIDLRVKQVQQPSTETLAKTLTLTTEDASCGITVQHSITLDPTSGVVHFATMITNSGDTPLSLEWLSAVCLPLDDRLSRLTSFTGKWAGEFQTESHDLVRGAFLRENRAGRTSHDSFPGFYLGSPQTSETNGPAAAFHLGWSGNHRLRVDRLADDTLMLQAGELPLPGEITLPPGERYLAPPLMGCWSQAGYGDVTRRLHRFVNGSLLKIGPERPVHFNTWEAVYFDHSQEKLMSLAEQAAEVGAERFVLDDGWFGARRNDRAGLGDWYVSEDVYPNGLKPLADHVRSLGMEFGLWFEPEMVNPDSDLYRAHPDWVLSAPGVDPIPSRHQLPLDLTRSEVCDYLFERITSLVDELGIAYVKWDMNRDIQHPGGSDGRANMHDQTVAVHTLIDRIKNAHPDVVIESCSSGGARADYAMLERTGRIWTSDNNDARARYAIMRGAAHFHPLGVLGNHVGPARCHITGRRFDMHFRAGTAIFGHMGMELDLAQEGEADRAILKAGITLHKRHRSLIHTGEYYRLETPNHIAGIGVVAEGQDEALFQIAVLDQHPAPHPPRVRFAGLDTGKTYTLSCQWPPMLEKEHGDFAGSALMDYGLQLPLTYPDTCLIYHVKATL